LNPGRVGKKGRGSWGTISKRRLDFLKAGAGKVQKLYNASGGRKRLAEKEPKKRGKIFTFS